MGVLLNVLSISQNGFMSTRLPNCAGFVSLAPQCTGVVRLVSWQKPSRVCGAK